MATVEALHRGGSIMGKRPTASHQHWTPTPMCVVQADDVRRSAVLVREAISRIERHRSCGAYVFVNPGNEVFVISEERLVVQSWVRERLAWLVGFYVTRHDGGTPVRPTIDGLEDDLRDQLDHVKSTVPRRQYGEPQPAGGHNSRHPVSGEPRCGGGQEGRGALSRGSGEGSGHD